LKIPPTKWEKKDLFLLYIRQCTDIRIYRELKKLNAPKVNDPIKEWANELNRTFSGKEVQMAKKHMKNVHHSWPYRKSKLKLH
jgi:hypothetical protein